MPINHLDTVDSADSSYRPITGKRLLVALFSSVLLSIVLAGCGSGGSVRPGIEDKSRDNYPPRPAATSASEEKAREVVVYALGLIGVGYRFGGKNPEAGVDCSGMVAYIFDKAIGLKVQGSAADIARKGRPVNRSELRPGDLVFFNTLNRPLSHVGIYIGEDRFVHAPSTRGSIRIDKLQSEYFATRFEAARGYFD